MNRFAEYNYKAIEHIVLNRDVLNKEAISLFIFLKDAFIRKSSVYDDNLPKLLEFVREERIKVSARVETPMAHTYIELAEVKDVNEYLLEKREELEKQTEEETLFRYAVFNDTIFDVSNEQTQQIVERIFSNPEKNTLELKQDIVKLWANQYYYNSLITVEKQILDQLYQSKPVELSTDNAAEQAVEDDEAPNVLTKAQRVIVFKLLDRVYKINRSQDAKSLNDFIGALTGGSIDDIKKFSSLADKNGLLVSTDLKQNIKDLNAVRPFFEKLEQLQILEIIDKAMLDAKSMKDN